MSGCVNRAKIGILHILLVLLCDKVCCHEKTLRKIVRDQQKMVQRSFSDSGHNELVWKNLTIPHLARTSDITFASGLKKVFHSKPRPNPIFSSMDVSRSMPTIYATEVSPFINEKSLRTVKALRKVSNEVPKTFPENVVIKDRVTNELEDTPSSNSPNLYDVRGVNRSIYFEDTDRFQPGPGEKKDMVVLIPDEEKKENVSLILKSVFPIISYARGENRSSLTPVARGESDDEKIDFLMEESPKATNYVYNATVSPYPCKHIVEATADIDLQDTFSELDIEPNWCTKRTFWNSIFDSRYESLMRDPKWPPLKVIMLLRSQVASYWRSSFEQYHTNTVGRILNNLVKKMMFYTNMTFSWNELSHLSHWWKTTTHQNRLTFRRLVKSGRLEVSSGFFVEPEEAVATLFSLVHQLIEGQQWIKQNLNKPPKAVWLTSSVAHSPTVTYLLAASDINYLVLTNLHFSWEKYLAEYQYSDFVWLQNWDSGGSVLSPLNDELQNIGTDRVPRHSVLTHYLQFNSPGIKACGPRKDMCLTVFNFARSNRNNDVSAYNVKDKAELLLEQYSKSGSITPHNVIIAPIGGPFKYESATEFDYQYNNYQRLADFINLNTDIYKANVKFGTTDDYFNEMLSRKRNPIPKVKGDFLNYADIDGGTPAYWSGYFTTRPMLKILLRRLQWALRSAEIIFSFACTSNVFEETNISKLLVVMERVRTNVARLADRNVAGGTLSVGALRHAHTLLLDTAKDCWLIQEVAASLLTGKQNTKKPYLQKYVYRNGDFISVFRSVVPGDQIYVFNSLSHERTEVVELISRQPNIRIVDHNKRDVTVQVNPIWRYNADKIYVSRKYFKIVFAVVIPPLTFELYKILETYDGLSNAAVVYCEGCAEEEGAGAVSPFMLQPLQPGDVQLESYKYRVIVDQVTGFLKTVVEKDTNIEKTVVIDYGAFRSSDVNSGMYLFNTNVTKPLDDTILHRLYKDPKIKIIISGHVTTELFSLYGKLLQHSIKLFNMLNGPLSKAIYVESKVDYEASPKNREIEMFMSIQTDISNGNPPRIYTDNNGFQYTARVLNISRRVESNLYPVTSMVYVQDARRRLTVVTEHAQGATALQEGQLLLMLDRRVLYSDGRGPAEGLADSSATSHRHYILLENLLAQDPRDNTQEKVTLPSLSALHLSGTLNYLLDIFLVDRNRTNNTYFTFFPLIKAPFPCDVSLVNFRIVFKKEHNNKSSSILNTALMVLHRQSFSCDVTNVIPLHCDGDMKINLDKVLRNIKSVYRTNLSGTKKGIVVKVLDHVNFPPMELATLRIHF